MSDKKDLQPLEFELEESSPEVPESSAKQVSAPATKVAAPLPLEFELDEPVHAAVSAPPPPTSSAPVKAQETTDHDLTLGEVTSAPLTESLGLEDPSEEMDLTIPPDPSSKPVQKEKISVSEPEAPSVESAEAILAPPTPPVEAVAPQSAIDNPPADVTEAVTEIITEEEPVRLADMVAKKLREAESQPKGEEGEFIEETLTPASKRKLPESLGFLSVLLLSITVLGVANWFYFGNRENPEEPKISVESVIKKEATLAKKAAKAKAEEVPVIVYPELHWQIDENSEQFALKGELVSKEAEILSAQLELTMPHPPMLSPEQLVRGEPPLPWLKQALSTTFQFEVREDKTFVARGSYKATVDDNGAMSRTILPLEIYGKVNYDQGSLSLKIVSGTLIGSENSTDSMSFLRKEDGSFSLDSAVTLTLIQVAKTEDVTKQES